MFKAGVHLIIITKIQKQPKCPSIDEWTKNTWHVCTQLNITEPFKNECNLVIWDNPDGSREYYGK